MCCRDGQRLAPERLTPGLAEVVAAWRHLDDIVIAAHVNPDGDAVGAMAACGHICQKLGKRFAIYTPTGLPEYLAFLPMPGPRVVNSFMDLPFSPKGAIYVDCSERGRLGPELAARLESAALPSINIDHHICEHGVGTLANYIHTGAAATCQLAAYVADAFGLPMSGPLGEAIGLGLIADTGRFAHGNTDEAVFELAARLSRDGTRLSEITEKLSGGIPLCKLRLWGELFGRVKVEGAVAGCSVTLADLRGHDCSSEALEGFVEWLRKIKGVKIGVLTREAAPGKCKYSLRSTGETSVQALAYELGGGGHKNAAGGTLEMTPAEAESMLIAAARASLEVEGAAK